MGFSSALIIIGATIITIGPKELPVFAHKFGFFCGRFISFVRSARSSLHEASKDPEIMAMTQEMEKGLQDLRKIKNEMEALRARRAVPYVMSKMTDDDSSVISDKKGEESVVGKMEKRKRSKEDLAKVPQIDSQLFHTGASDKIEMTGGADLLIECVQQRETVRSWKKQTETKN